MSGQYRGESTSVMSFRGESLSVFLLVCLLVSPVGAGEGELSDEAIKTAIQKSLPLLEKGAKGSLQQRKQCFNCHNQGLPLMAMIEAEARGIAIDSALRAELVQFTSEFLARNKLQYLEGRGQGGQIDTAGYALWTLEKEGTRPNETTSAVVEYLLIYQNQLDHYESDSNRPPSEQSDFTSTYVAVRAMTMFGTVDQKELIDMRIERIREWLLKSLPHDNEDRVFRLRGLHLMNCGDDIVKQAADDLKSTQNPDGSWSQAAEMSGDAYATSTALVALHEAGGISTADPVYRRGLAYLVSQQLDDGSWHVVSHAKPFQSYFETGYPHGKDQFISSAAASWSTISLALALPKVVSDAK